MGTSTFSTTSANAGTLGPGGTHRAKRLLRAGVAAGPFFVIAGLAQMPFRDGFDPTKHAFSFLLIGPQGWIEMVVFLVAGVLYGLSGLGLLRVLGGRAGTVALIASLGLALGKAIAGLNAPQPSFGYPLGTPDGPPSVLTTGSMLHGAGFGLAVTAWMVLLVTLGLALRRRGSGLCWLAFVVVVALPVIPATSGSAAGAVPLYVIATAAYLTTSFALHRLASPL
jgi:hypothetical protein